MPLIHSTETHENVYASPATEHLELSAYVHVWTGNLLHVYLYDIQSLPSSSEKVSWTLVSSDLGVLPGFHILQ